MKVMISRDERGRALIKTVDSLNLQDLSGASDDQIKAVTNLVWEIKALFHTLISGKASDVLADLNIGGEAKLSANLVADLTASIPRDVVISAQQQWLPNLAMEIGKGRDMSDQSGWNTAITVTGSVSTEEPSESDAPQEAPSLSPEAAASEAVSKAKLDPPVCTMSILGQCLLFKGGEGEAEAAKAKAAQSEGAASDAPANSETANADADGGEETLSADEQPQAAKPEGAAGDAPTDSETANAKPDGGEEVLSADEQPQAAKPEGAAGDAKPDGGKEALSADEPPQQKAKDQTDDLLFPTEDELRAIKEAERAAERGRAASDAPANADGAAGEPQTGAAPVTTIESDVDPESWAEYGGWYRQDYAIFYRPTGHKDKFIYSWLFLTGPQAPKGDTSPAAAVFDFLTSKDAQGSCTKCHSVDDIRGKGRVVNFSPPSVAGKRGRFTNFIHEPHFQAVGIGQRIGILENHGCLTCHVLEKGAPYLKSYEQGNPKNFVSNFGGVKKDLCQTCHTSSTARQDCLLCHKYHVNGVNTPIMNTKIPIQEDGMPSP
jgi:hypothetical protein